MDNIDIKILKLLQQNSRVTASEISTRINLSIPAVGDRLKKLDNAGIIEKYTIILSAKKFNKDLMIIMFVSLESPKFTDLFINTIQVDNEIVECHYLAGDYDYVLKIITGSTESLEKILNKIKNIPGVQKTKTTVSLSTIKNNYSIIPSEIIN
ncbi:Lrp/AsnC family transcriptional regulator [Clostridium estertheticum]|uniref:Lrp/AsnC family transcriptional regulator n=1 Tax=Clostridium estertheticum TaxID=238834 RepID=UPI001C6E41A2|nr:Lrp/AsnC family transcriptional regulator [Clostridium estertheticum]MBW9172002.1 Lrp/AsnC family transcriptional regulator [Clostridium estertheticum]WLC73713.1 Lrp/AsnC family transcriptional regulator [Clostridium estertheticum]